MGHGDGDFHLAVVPAEECIALIFQIGQVGNALVAGKIARGDFVIFKAGIQRKRVHRRLRAVLDPLGRGQHVAVGHRLQVAEAAVGVASGKAPALEGIALLFRRGQRNGFARHVILNILIASEFAHNIKASLLGVVRLGIPAHYERKISGTTVAVGISGKLYRIGVFRVAAGNHNVIAVADPYKRKDAVAEHVGISRLEGYVSIRQVHRGQLNADAVCGHFLAVLIEEGDVRSRGFARVNLRYGLGRHKGDELAGFTRGHRSGGGVGVKRGRRGRRHLLDDHLDLRELVGFVGVGGCLGGLGVNVNRRFAKPLGGDFAAGHADRGDGFVLAKEADNVGGVFGRKGSMQRMGGPDGAERHGFNVGCNLGGAHEHIERFGRDGLTGFGALGRNLDRAGRGRLHFAGGRADGRDFLVGGVEFDMLSGNLQRIGMPCVNGGRGGRAAFERDLAGCQRGGGQQLRQHCEKQHE